MISCLAQGTDLEFGLRLRNRQRIMQRFEAWLEENQDRPVRLLDICVALGVPARTLKFCCHEFVGMGPTQYLRRRRMQLVRRALQQATAETTVFEVATSFGFWELGRFAGAYRDLFGELPSATLAGARFS